MRIPLRCLICSLWFLGAVPAAVVADQPDDVAATAAQIDQHLFGRMQALQVTPAGPAGDAEFLRRVWLDVAGRIPPASRVSTFLADAREDKRSQELERLLQGNGYANHFTDFWRDVLMPEARSDERVRPLLGGFDTWLRGHLSQNTRYNQLVDEILTTPLARKGEGQEARRRGAEQSAIAFFQAKEIAPENLAAATSRIFLGIRIECAQCHDHPFDEWKRQQFWSFASFFAGIERTGDGGVFGRVEEIFDRRELRIPESESVVQAGFLDGAAPRWRRGVGSRNTLAAWMTSNQNPYFARAAVNRIWGKLFGVGMVDPVDDFTDVNECSHPELLSALSQRFIESDFDLQFLIRSIVSSRAYQLSSVQPHADPDGKAPADSRNFAVMHVKGLTSDQQYDSLSEAIGLVESSGQRDADNSPGSPRAEFMDLFANDTDPPTQQQTSILQALALMNGRIISSGAELPQGRTLAALNARALNVQEQVDALFLATLSRPPTIREQDRCVAFLQTGDATRDLRRARADLFWALLNSAEFASNH